MEKFRFLEEELDGNNEYHFKTKDNFGWNIEIVWNNFSNQPNFTSYYYNITEIHWNFKSVLSPELTVTNVNNEKETFSTNRFYIESSLHNEKETIWIKDIKEIIITVSNYKEEDFTILVNNFIQMKNI